MSFGGANLSTRCLYSFQTSRSILLPLLLLAILQWVLVIVFLRIDVVIMLKIRRRHFSDHKRDLRGHLRSHCVPGSVQDSDQVEWSRVRRSDANRITKYNSWAWKQWKEKRKGQGDRRKLLDYLITRIRIGPLKEKIWWHLKIFKKSTSGKFEQIFRKDGDKWLIIFDEFETWLTCQPSHSILTYIKTAPNILYRINNSTPHLFVHGWMNLRSA